LSRNANICYLKAHEFVRNGLTKRGVDDVFHTHTIPNPPAIFAPGVYVGILDNVETKKKSLWDIQ